MYDLSGKVAVVTGAGGKRGLGRAIARRLALEGADVAVSDKVRVPPRSEDLTDGWQGIDSVADEIKAAGRRALSLTCNVADSKEVEKMVFDTVSEFGRLDILVNNAGVDIYGHALDLTDEVWNLHLAVNLSGTFFCSRAAARVMVAKGEGGKIINIASLLGKVGMGNAQIAYSSSKFGVIGFTQCLALEMSSHNILVNAVCPALTATDIHNDDFEDMAEKEGISPKEVETRALEKVAAQVPLGRLGTPGEVASMVAFLASSKADFITGQSFDVTGGLLTAY